MSVALIAVAAVVVVILFLLSASVRVAREYERGVIFRLGRLNSPPKGPGSSCSSRSSTRWCGSTCER